MKIFIKSFNRPYYLDRCITSIYDNVIGENLSITVLDDGTDEMYLSKLKSKFPDVEFRLSEYYTEKVDAIKKLSKGNFLCYDFKIPSEFWLSNILNDDDKFFMLLEDDMWIKKTIDISVSIDLMTKNNMCILKMFHFNNPIMYCGEKKIVNNDISIVVPKLFTKNIFLFKTLFTKNFFKINVINHFLGLISFKNKRNYYTIYNVAGAIFSKDYYNFLWKDFKGKVNEDSQLIKALSYHNLNPNEKYGLFENDVVGTSFTSSATNMFSDIDLNIFVYNRILNDYWLNDEFNPIKGLPSDIDSSEIERILILENNSKASVDSWKRWSFRFKTQYRNVGHVID